MQSSLGCDMVAGHPAGSVIHTAMDARRGYLHCLCTDDDAEPVAIVWDLHSGQCLLDAAIEQVCSEVLTTHYQDAQQPPLYAMHDFSVNELATSLQGCKTGPCGAQQHMHSQPMQLPRAAQLKL